MIRRIILIVVFVILFFPILELKFDFFEEKKLKGAYKKTKDIEFSLKGWFGGEYQPKKEKFLKNIIGFKPLLTRINNQIDFSLFSLSHANGIVVGKNDMLFQNMYIDAYYGKDFSGNEYLTNEIRKYSKLVKVLREEGIDLFLIIAPGKASMYPENIPDHLKADFDTTNYDKVVEQLNQSGCNYLDLRSYFLSLKKESEYPLFPDHGTHWSGYAITLAADTIFSFLESNTRFALRKYSKKDGELSNDYRFSDNDIGKALNLLGQSSDQLLYYPDIVFENNDTLIEKPKVLLVGDSFTQSFWGFYPYFDKLFDKNSRFWYYNRNVAWPDKNIKKVIKQDIHKEITSHDIIIIFSTEQNLKDPGFGFIDKTLKLLTNDTVLCKEKLNFYTNSIKSNSSLYRLCKRKAIDRNISIDSMLFLDARWLFNRYLIDYYSKGFKNKPDSSEHIALEPDSLGFYSDSLIYLYARNKSEEVQKSIISKWYVQDKEIDSLVEVIKSTPNWYDRMKNKAKEKNVSLETQLRNEAKWVLDRKNYKGFE